ncbi:hypothetical protein O181_121344, partial [Austropuccinia psidii MF-1]|nr:hypothetical protein [Austropuccinia psidii MF-1]
MSWIWFAKAILTNHPDSQPRCPRLAHTYPAPSSLPFNNPQPVSFTGRSSTPSSSLIFQPSIMVLCQCTQCSTYTWTNCDGYVKSGRFISGGSKCKHIQRDIANSKLHQVASTSCPQSQFETSVSSNSSRPNSEDELSIVLKDSSSFEGLVFIFVIWLHLFCALSLENCRIAFQFIADIILAYKQEPDISFSKRKIASDPRTMIKNLGIEADLDEVVCCQKCFFLYEGRDIPMTCTYQEQPRGKNCDFPLLKEKTCYSALQDKGIANHQNSQVHKNKLLKISNPICVYYTKSITRWLQWFLGQQKTENEIENWAKIVTTLPYIQDIQQALAWKDMVWPVLSNEAPLKLVFSLFIDWFNPR